MGLKLYRRIDQQLLLTVVPGTTAEELLEQLEHGITVQVCDIQRNQTRLNISAPDCLSIIRPEKHSAEAWVGRHAEKQSTWQRLRQLLRALVHPT